MADIIKVKPKKNYEWNQDKKFIYVQIPLPLHTSLKKVDIYLSDFILRVTSLEKKQPHFLDLAQEIDYKSPDNKFILTNGLLHATLKKATPDVQWVNLLIEGISLADLKVRRRQSELRYEQNVKTVEENKDKLRTDYDRKATQELMRFQQEEKEILETKKKIEKENAIREVFSNVNEKTGQFQKEKKKENYLEIERQEDKWSKKEKIALTMLEEEEEKEKLEFEKERKEKNKHKIIEEVTKQYQKEKYTTKNTMFTEEQIHKYEEIRQNIDDGVQFQEIPIRKAGTQKVTFTERIHKNLAARDQFYKEPPMPKSKGNQLTNGDVQSKNPLWLKDKGDSFFKDKNYVSAIEAYSESLRIESKLLSAVLNRCVCYMKMFKFQQAINDCDQSLLILQSQISGTEEEQKQSCYLLAKIKTRKAICTAWKGQLESARSILKEVLDLQLNEEIINQVKNCEQQIGRRQQSIRNKAKGDELVRLNQHQTAIIHYDRAIQIDENEYATSNKVLCLNKVKEYKNSSEQAEKGIKKLAMFNLGISNQTKEDKQVSLILLKLYYRKAKALEEMGSLTQAEQHIRKGLTINSDDKDLQEYLKTLKKRQNKQLIKSMKQESVSLIKQTKVKQALENYSKCLKLLQQAEDIQEYLAILQNQCVCYQKLQKYDDVLSICIRILKIVNRIESKIIQFGAKKEASSLDKDELKKISVRTLVRRANAYIKTSQFYNAKSDLEKAYEINPEESIKKELQNLKTKLTTIN